MSRFLLVSVLMPAYNAEDFIREAIKSILNQTHENWELLVLNDASTDNTKSIVESFSDDRIQIFEHDINQGYLISCNELFKKSKGDFITFLDADDTCPANRLSKCLEKFESKPKLDFLTTDYIRTNSSGKTISEHSLHVDYERYINDPGYSPIICCATIFLRRSLYEKVDGYHPIFKDLGGEDYHWLWQLSLNGMGAHFNEQLYCYRQHNEQVHVTNSNPLKLFTMDILKEIRVKNLSNEELTKEASSLNSKWKNFVNNNPAFVELRRSTEALNRKQHEKFWKHWFNALWLKPLSVSKFKQCTYLLYSFSARIA